MLKVKAVIAHSIADTKSFVIHEVGHKIIKKYIIDNSTFMTFKPEINQKIEALIDSRGNVVCVYRDC